MDVRQKCKGFKTHPQNSLNIRVFPKIVVPQNAWFIMENPIKMDDLGVPITFGNTHCKVPESLG